MKTDPRIGRINRTVTADFEEHDISNDLVVNFACGPLFQLSFATEEGALEILLRDFSDRIYRVQRWSDKGGATIRQVVLRFGPLAWVHIRNGPSHCIHVYADSAKKAEVLEKRIRALLPKETKRSDAPHFFMLRKDGDSMSIEKVLNTSALLDDESMQLTYGSDSLKWMEEFSVQTKTKIGGISILDGPPGTGKSTLIAQLMRRLDRTHVFYVLSVAQHELLSHSGMVEFWQDQNGRRPNEVKVVIMEDAEKILLQRRSDNDEAVSALLNIADGLIGQMLRVHVLCTLNQGMEYLDPAILRPGRLRSYRYVGFLSRDGAVKLAAKHNRQFQPDANRDQYTLAEVFHGTAYEAPPSRTVGFSRQPRPRPGEHNPAARGNTAKSDESPVHHPRP